MTGGGGADGGTVVPGTLEAARPEPLAPATLDLPYATVWSWARGFTTLHHPSEDGGHKTIVPEIVTRSKPANPRRRPRRGSSVRLLVTKNHILSFFSPTCPSKPGFPRSLRPLSRAESPVTGVPRAISVCVTQPWSCALWPPAPRSPGQRRDEAAGGGRDSAWNRAGLGSFPHEINIY